MRFQFTSKFAQSYTKAHKRGKDVGKLEHIMDCIIQGQPLPPRCRDHALTGNFKGIRECHIEPDWLLLYYRDAKRITFVDTGSHADLFR